MPLEPLAPAALQSTAPSGGAAHGERRLITILFADLSGFTALSQKLDPEDVREVANVCFSFLNTAITARGGMVHKYEGDLVIALFGYPAAHEDDPERAIQASLEMFDLLDSINRAVSLRLRLKTHLGLHIGISCGTVVVGEVGTPEKREHTVMGDTVNLASRLKDAAKRGEILVSEPVYRAARYRFDFTEEEPVSAKGMEHPVRVFRPGGEKSTPDPKRGIPGLSSPLVGRDRELGLLQGLVRRLAGGKGGASFVLGDAGLGKSRLLEELRKSLPGPAPAVTWLEGRCISHGETLPYWPFLQMLREAFGIADQDSLDAVKGKLSGGVRDLFPESWGEILPFLGYLFSVRFSEEIDERGKYLDPQGLKAQIFLSVRKTFAALARERPLLLVIEDYHWIDAESLEFLEYLCDFPEPLTLGCLCLSRDEKDKAGYRTKERLKAKLGKRFTEIVLKPLDEAEGAQLFSNLMRTPGIPKRFQERILAKAEGNPFFLEEILRSLIDAGVLVYSDGVWKYTSAASSWKIPDTVQAVIGSRLDHLDPEARNMLQIAAVIGRGFPVPVLERVWGRDPMLVMLYLADLDEHGFIHEVKRDPEWEFSFVHPLLHEVTYAGLLKAARRELHRQVGEAIEALFPDRLEDFCEILAHQYAEGDDPEKALEWLGKAGRKAGDRYANDEAIGYYRKMVSLLEQDGKGQDRELCAAYEALAKIHHLKGEYGEVLSCYDTVLRHAGGDPVRQAHARGQAAVVHAIQERDEEALRLLDEAEGILAGTTPEERVEKADLSIVRSRVFQGMGASEKARNAALRGLEILESLQAGESPLVRERVSMLSIRAYNMLGVNCTHSGELDKALEFFRKSLDLAERFGKKGDVCVACNNIGSILHRNGKLDEAVHFLEQAKTTAEEIGRRSTLARAYNNLGLVYRTGGDFDLATEYFERALEIYEELGEKQAACMPIRNLGVICQEREDLARAKVHYLESLSRAEAIGYQAGIAMATCDLALLYASSGDSRQAERCFQRSEEISAETGFKENLLTTWIGFARLKAEQAGPGGPPSPEALGYTEKALQLAGELNQPRSQADCFLIYARAHARAGDFPRAEEYFLKGLAVYEACKEKKLIAEAYLDYARMLKRAPAGTGLEGKAGEYFQKARALFQAMNLPHKVQECQG